jgi:uncharacterized protein
MITALYAAALALIYVGLSGFVILGRYKHKASLGDAGDTHMQKRIRIHGNFAEYVPMGLILMILIEQTGYAPFAVHLMGSLLLAGRVAHAWGLLCGTFGRQLGMVLTFTMLIAASGLLIWRNLDAFLLN